MVTLDVDMPQIVIEVSCVDCLDRVSLGREGRVGVEKRYGVGVSVVEVGMPEEMPIGQSLIRMGCLLLSDFVG